MTKYTFDEAIARCKPGQIVKHTRSGWNEYFTQYGRSKAGKAYWTAGWTVGGDLVQENIPFQDDTEWEIWIDQHNKAEQE